MPPRRQLRMPLLPAASSRARVEQYASAAWRRAQVGGAWLRRRWQHSLQVRVGATTLVVTGVVVLIVGLFIVNQVGDGVLRAKRDAAIRQATVGLTYAQRRCSPASTSPTAATVVEARQSAARRLRRAGGSGAGLFSIAVVSAIDSHAGQQPIGASRPTLRTRRAARQPGRAVRAGRRSADTDAGARADRRRAGAGAQRRCSSCTTCSRSPPSSRRSRWCSAPCCSAGSAWCCSSSAIALLVTRQVVRPVRVAAQTAGRLAAGDLSQRISVRGTDDIARLGRVVQRHGRQPATPDPPPRGPVAAAAALHQRRLARAAHPADDDPDGVGAAARQPRRVPARAVPLAPSCCTTELDRFEALLGDLLEISRYDAGVAQPGVRDRRHPQRRRRRPSTRAACSPSGTAARSSCTRRPQPGDRRHGRAPGRAHPAQPASATRSTTARAGRS